VVLANRETLDCGVDAAVLEADTLSRARGTSGAGVKNAGVLHAAGGNARLLNWADDARAYNEVVTSWSAIETAAAKESSSTQRALFDQTRKARICLSP